MKIEIVKWGDSYALRIPEPVIKLAHLKEGDFLEVEAAEGQIELRQTGKILSLAQLTMCRC